VPASQRRALEAIGRGVSQSRRYGYNCGSPPSFFRLDSVFFGASRAALASVAGRRRRSGQTSIQKQSSIFQEY
jgi:hypothetical protein